MNYVFHGYCKVGGLILNKITATGILQRHVYACVVCYLAMGELPNLGFDITMDLIVKDDTASGAETTDLEAGPVLGPAITELLFIPFRLDVYQADMEKRRLDIIRRGHMRVRRLHDFVVVMCTAGCFVSYLATFLVMARAMGW